MRHPGVAWLSWALIALWFVGFMLWPPFFFLGLVPALMLILGQV